MITVQTPLSDRMHKSSKRFTYTLSAVSALAAIVVIGLGIAVRSNMSQANANETTSATNGDPSPNANQPATSNHVTVLPTPINDDRLEFDSETTVWPPATPEPATSGSPTGNLVFVPSNDLYSTPLDSTRFLTGTARPEVTEQEFPEEAELVRDRHNVAQEIIARLTRDGMLPNPNLGNDSNTIRPFGELTWNDDVLTALRKMRKLDSLKTLTLHLSIYHGRSVNALDIDHSSQLQNSMALTFGNSHGWTIKEDHSIDRPFTPYNLAIKAYPIFLGEGIFQLHAEFHSYPGLLLTDSQRAQASAQAQQLFGKNSNLYCPLRLTFVKLTLEGAPEYPNPTNEQIIRITNNVQRSLDINYPRSVFARQANSRNGQLISIVWSDKYGHQLSLNKDEIRYGNTQLTSYKILFERYSEHFDQLQDQKRHDRIFAKAKDLRSQL